MYFLNQEPEKRSVDSCQACNPITQKAAFKKIIDLNDELGVSAIKTMASLIFEVDDNGRYTEMALIK